jgi:hypothetical protein
VLLLVGAEYRNDLSSVAPGAVPKEFQPVGGAFNVVEIEKKKVLEVPGVPLEIAGLLFGPADHAALDARAKAWGAASGRRFPEIGVGVGGLGGYRLLLLPAQKRLELRRGDEPVKSAEMPQPWRSATWTVLRLRVAKDAQGKWLAQGKSWPADAQEPKDWQIAHELTGAPPAGRASLWAIPFSCQPIRFDDLTAGEASGG